MKQTGNLVLLSLLTITACKKDYVNTALQSAVAGSWELHKVYVYTNVNNGIIDYGPGNGNTLTFGPDGHYTQTTVNADTSYSITGKYTLPKEDDCGINLKLTADHTNETYTNSIHVQQDTLMVGAGNCIADAGTYIYLRK